MSLAPIVPHWQDNVVMMLVKFEHYLNTGNLVGSAVRDGFGGTEEICGFGSAVNPNAAIFKVKTGIFLLEQNPHR